MEKFFSEFCYEYQDKKEAKFGYTYDYISGYEFEKYTLEKMEVNEKKLTNMRIAKRKSKKYIDNKKWFLSL